MFEVCWLGSGVTGGVKSIDGWVDQLDAVKVGCFFSDRNGTGTGKLGPCKYPPALRALQVSR